ETAGSIMCEARQPFEPDPGRAGVGTGTPRRTLPPSARNLPDHVQLAQRRSTMPDSAPLSSAKLAPRIEELHVTTGPFPSSRKIAAPGRLHPEISVAMREIDLEASSGEPPIRAYDTSGLYSDPAAEIDINRGLPELRKPWILARGDV